MTEVEVYNKLSFSGKRSYESITKFISSNQQINLIIIHHFHSPPLDFRPQFPRRKFQVIFQNIASLILFEFAPWQVQNHGKVLQDYRWKRLKCRLPLGSEQTEEYRLFKNINSSVFIDSKSVFFILFCKSGFNKNNYNYYNLLVSE